MKQALLSLAAICGIVFQSLATTYTVTVSDFSFSPSALTVHPGDVITWVWNSGSHTTTSTTLPSGAPAWDKPINASNTSYSYTVPSIFGVYNYKCTPHASMGMTASFTVVDPTYVPAVTGSSFALFPNPASKVTHLQFANTNEPATVYIYDLTGRVVYGNSYNQATQADIDVQVFGAGIYMVCVQQAGAIYRRELVIQ